MGHLATCSHAENDIVVSFAGFVVFVLPALCFAADRFPHLGSDDDGVSTISILMNEKKPEAG